MASFPDACELDAVCWQPVSGCQPAYHDFVELTFDGDNMRFSNLDGAGYYFNDEVESALYTDKPKGVYVVDRVGTIPNGDGTVTNVAIRVETLNLDTTWDTDTLEPDGRPADKYRPRNRILNQPNNAGFLTINVRSQSNQIYRDATTMIGTIQDDDGNNVDYYAYPSYIRVRMSFVNGDTYDESNEENYPSPDNPSPANPVPANGRQYYKSQLVTLPRTMLSVYDFDGPATTDKTASKNKYINKEGMYLRTSGLGSGDGDGVPLAVLSYGSEVKVEKNGGDYGPTALPVGVTPTNIPGNEIADADPSVDLDDWQTQWVEYCGSTEGGSQDTPSQTETLQPLEKNRPVTLAFHNVQEFEVAFMSTCCMGPGGGRNFNIAGPSDVIDICPTPPFPPPS